MSVAVGGWAGEIVATLRLSAPMALAQLGLIAINTTDVLLLGWLGAVPLAAASLGLGLFHVCLLFGIGVVQAASPLLASAAGARRPLEIRRVAQQSLWLALAVALPLMAILWWIRPVLALLGQDENLLPHTELFTRILLLAMPGALGFVALRCFTTAFSDTRPILVVSAIAIPLNALLGWSLIFGYAGLPALGVAGAALASVLTNSFMFVVMLVWSTRGRYRRFRLLAGIQRRDGATFLKLLRLGLPIGGALLLEVGVFASSTLLAGILGTAQLAAHQVTLQVASFFFMLPLGVGMAATIRVGLAQGRADLAGARRAGFVALGLGVGLMSLVAIVFWTGAEALVGLFLSETGPVEALALGYAATFLHVAALFQIVDGLQVIGISALRGLQDTRVPMLLAAIGYWVIGFPACYLLGLHTSLGGVGIWSGLAFGLAAVGVTMAVRFDRMTRPSAALAAVPAGL
ncbi:MAG: MATE family efflux transporter [Geminicoccaceae bacterium]